MIPFRKPSLNNKTGTKNGTFDFLGFTFFWAGSRQGYCSPEMGGDGVVSELPTTSTLLIQDPKLPWGLGEDLTAVLSHNEIFFHVVDAIFHDQARLN